MRKTGAHRRWRRKFNPYQPNEQCTRRLQERYDIKQRHERKDPVQTTRKCLKCGMVNGNLEYSLVKRMMAARGNEIKRCSYETGLESIININLVAGNCPRCKHVWPIWK